MDRHHLIPFACTLSIFAASTAAQTSRLPAGFQEEVVVTQLSRPTAMAFAPDGKLFITEQTGRIRVVTASGELLASPFATLPTYTEGGGRGLMGIVVDPNFEQNGYVYVCYTTNDRPAIPERADSRIQRISRLKANGNVAIPGSERVLVDGLTSDDTSHSGGGLEFGSDGMLYVATGDGAGFSEADALALRALDLDSLNGKVLRLNPTDGTAPADNPFYVGPTANRSKVWCLGLRNPFHMAVKPGTNTLFVNDVGWFTWEEVNVTYPGANFGWPCQEGTYPQFLYQSAFPDPCAGMSATSPLYSYSHSGGGQAITGGTFLAHSTFPARFAGNYFFADYVQGVIQRIVLTATGELEGIHPFAYGGPEYTVVDLAEGPFGDLHVLHIGADLARQTGWVSRISWVGAGNHAPVAHVAASPSNGYAPLEVAFTSAGSSDADGDSLAFFWNFADGQTSTSPNPTHRFEANGVYVVRLTVNDGHVERHAALTITVGSLPPTVRLLTPGDGLRFETGQPVRLIGFGEDPDDGILVPVSLQWTIILHHEDHFHPFVDTFGRTATFVPLPHGDGDISYEIVLTGTDSSGLSAIERVEIFPTENLATKRPARASSFQPRPAYTGVPEDGNDGSEVDETGRVRGWHSRENTGALEWWQVDLGRPYTIHRLELAARPDVDEPVARRNFQVLGRNDATFTTGSVVLGSQGGDPFPARGTWSASVSIQDAFQFVRVQKTVADAFFDITEFRVFGAIPFERDLSVLSVTVDFDPADPDVDPGPGAIAQSLDVVATVRNVGTQPITNAELRATIGSVGTSQYVVSRVLDDFGPEIGRQPLAPGAITEVRLPYDAGILVGCASYTLVVENDPLVLATDGGGLGDEAPSNDRLVSVGEPDLRLADIEVRIDAESAVIEDSQTEPLGLEVTFTGVGPGGDDHDLRFVVDVLLGDTLVRESVRRIRQPHVASDRVATARLNVDLSAISPPLELGQPYRIRVRALDRLRLVLCAVGTSSSTFTIQH